jgi:hypothetical protein
MRSLIACAISFARMARRVPVFLRFRSDVMKGSLAGFGRRDRSRLRSQP